MVGSTFDDYQCIITYLYFCGCGTLQYNFAVSFELLISNFHIIELVLLTFSYDKRQFVTIYLPSDKTLAFEAHFLHSIPDAPLWSSNKTIRAQWPLVPARTTTTRCSLPLNCR